MAGPREESPSPGGPPQPAGGGPAAGARPSGGTSRTWLVLGLLFVVLVLGQGLYILRERGRVVPRTEPGPQASRPAGPRPGGNLSALSSRPRPFTAAAPDDYDVKEYMFGILEAEKAAPTLTARQAEQMLQLFLGTYPDLRASRELYNGSAEILTAAQKEFLDRELDFYKPPTLVERRAFYERLRELAGSPEVEDLALPPALVKERKSVPYLDLLVTHFDEVQEDGDRNLSLEQMRALLPYYRHFLEAGICPTTDTCLAEILTEEQREAVAGIMMAHSTTDDQVVGVEERFMAYLRSRI